MPDHVHLLVRVLKGGDIVLFVRKFKSLVTKTSKRYFERVQIWQRSFFDHFLREEESIEEVADYILNNPVRKGLVANRRDYPFSGSTFDS
jgi:REP element-mobilizing transposase RayT